MTNENVKESRCCRCHHDTISDTKERHGGFFVKQCEELFPSSMLSSNCDGDYRLMVV